MPRGSGQHARPPELRGKRRRKLLGAGEETGKIILIVDDEHDVRAVIAGMLGEMGFRTIEASSGQEALDRSASYPGEIHLLLTDLIMPGMTGRQLADTLAALRPGISVVFMSGYIQSIHQKDLEHGLLYLRKPVDWLALERMVNSALKKGGAA